MAIIDDLKKYGLGAGLGSGGLADGLNLGYKEYFPEVQEKAPPILYHYCSNESFFNIVGNKNVRLMPFFHANDSEELTYGLRLIRECTEYFIEKEPKKVKKKALISLHNKVHDALLKDQLLFFCLSENGDQLSQWRGYGNDAQGVSMGFDMVTWQKRAQFNTGLSFSLGDKEQLLLKVVYLKNEQYQLIANILEVFLDKAKNEESTEEGAVNKLLNCCRMFKSPAFLEEQEWRLVMTFPQSSESQEDYDFCINGEIINPFYSLPIEGLIKTLYLGSKNPSKINSLGWFLEKRGFFGVEVKHSSATYR